MSDQGLLDFSGPSARHSDPETSHQAAECINDAALKARILETFEQFGLLNDDELCSQLPDLYPPTVKACRSRLSKGTPPSLVATATRRPSNRGRAMICWELA